MTINYNLQNLKSNILRLLIPLKLPINVATKIIGVAVKEIIKMEEAPR